MPLSKHRFELDEARLFLSTVHVGHRSRSMSTKHNDSLQADDISFDERKRRREWNRGPITDLFPRIPSNALDRVLDLAISKPFVYNLSESKHWNARRLTSIIVAHARHACTDYDKLLREGVERFEARHQTAERLWKVLREWSPWEEDNEALERCYRATLLRPEERDAAGWDPMDVDEESDFEGDPMEID